MTSESHATILTIEDLVATSLTEEQIERYHAIKKRAAFQKKQLIIFNRQKRIARYRLLRTIMLVLFTGATFFYGVYLTTEVSLHQRQVLTMQDALRERIRENDDMERRIYDSVDILALKEKAISMGLVYPDPGSIIHYDPGSDNYMQITET